MTGCSNFKVNVVEDHEQSQAHIHATSVRLAKEKPRETPAYKMLTKMKEHEVETLKVLFRNANAIGKKCRPLRDFTWMAELDQMKGIGKIGDGYKNDKAACIHKFHLQC